MKRFVAAIGFCLLLSSHGYAQDTKKVDPVVRKEAQMLVRAANYEAMYYALVPMIQNTVMQVILQAAPNIDDESRKIIGETIGTHFEANVPAWVDGAAEIYAAHFTLDEMKELIAFYSTPTGKKMADRTPAMGIQFQTLSGIMMKKVMETAMPDIQSKLRKRGVKI
jgi:hypothetical protein